MPLLTHERREKFAHHLARGVIGLRAAIEAGYAPSGASVRAAELKRRPDVMARVKELRDQLDCQTVKNVVADRNWVLTNLIEIAEEARAARDRPAATKALELVGRELGLFVNRTMEVKSPLDALSAKELLALVDLIDSGKLTEAGVPAVADASMLQLGNERLSG